MFFLGQRDLVSVTLCRVVAGWIESSLRRNANVLTL